MEPIEKPASDEVEVVGQEDRVQLPTFLNRSVPSNSHCLASSVDVLKNFMAYEENRRPFARSGDLFLKPLPAYGYYGRSTMTSQLGFGGGGYPFPCFYGNCFQPFDHCLHSPMYRSSSEPSAIGQNQSSDSEKDEKNGILKKPRVPETKDITINNSLVFIPNLSGKNSDNKGISELSSKLIEDFNKLKDEGKEAKMVQFDLSGNSPVKDNLDNSFKTREPFSSLSTNESLPWQPASTSSPTSTTSARMEWDSAADVGYIEVDLSKDKLSSLERITLQGMAQKGAVEKKVVYKKTTRADRILQRIPSDLVEIEERKAGPVMKETGTNPETETRLQTFDSITQTTDEATLVPETLKTPKKPRKSKKPQLVENKVPEMKDQCTFVNTLDEEVIRKLSTSSEEPQTSARVKKRTKKRDLEDAPLPAPPFPQPNTPSTESNSTILPQRSFESKGVQVKTSPKLMSSKNIQASGELNSLPKHLDNAQLSKASGGARSKSTQFFGEGVHSLPRGLEKGGRSKKPAPQPETRKLTRKTLKQRHESADKELVRKRFFQSQMVSQGTEIGKSLVETASAATSMTRADADLTLDFETIPQSTLMDRSAETVPKTATVGVQYSPKEDSQPVRDERPEVRNAWTDTIDSQASSTQTADSWVHGGAPARESVVRPTRSFEYLPGAVYENSNNIREVLPSETSQNVITESESSAESVQHPHEDHQSDSEGGRKLSGGTVVVDDSCLASPGAWLVVKGDAVDVMRGENVGISEISGKFTSGSDKQQESVARRNKCSAGVQTDSIVDSKHPELIKVLKDLHALLATKRSNHNSIERKSATASNGNGSTTTSCSSLYAVINKTGLRDGKRLQRATSTPQACSCNDASGFVAKSPTGTEITGNTAESFTSEKCTTYSGSLPPTPRLEFVSVASQSEKNPTHHQSTQMSERNTAKDTATQMGSTLRYDRKTERPRNRQDQATQISYRAAEAAPPVLPNSGSHQTSRQSTQRNAPVCNTCGKCGTCACGEKVARDSKSTSSRKLLKTINGEVFSTYLDVDFSSSEITSSTSTAGNGKKVKSLKNSKNDKENNCVCAVCHCRSDNQDCVFCPCHIDKKTHIPKCDCHDKVPRYLIPGFCKCHKRNLRHVNKCKCSEELSNVENNKCPCCEYFASRMRSQLLAAQIGALKISGKSPASARSKNYFLKLEETEMSKDSSDVSEVGQKPLEVVTIKIPVKRMGNAKVPCKQFYYTGNAQRSKHDDIEFLDDIVRKYRGVISSRQSYPKGSLSDRPSVATISSYRTLQECLESNRPDFLSSAEYRRQLINDRAREREKRQIDAKTMMNRQQPAPVLAASKRMFTTAELHRQTLKHYKNLPEVAHKKEKEKKRELYRTNKLMAEIYAKKLQLKTLRGQLNFSNSCDLLTT